MSLYQKILITIVLILGLFLRLYRLDSPVADWHSHRQADTASVTRIFSQNGIDLLHPRYHDLSNVQSGQENPQGWRMVEFPIYNAASVYFHQIFHSNLEISSRLISIVFSLFSALLIFLICFQLTHCFWPSFFSLTIFLFLPFNIYYSRTILPEPSAVFFMLLTLYLFPKNIYFSAFSLAIAILLKPYTAIIIFPTLLLFSRQKKYFLSLLPFFLISIIPFLAWRWWISRYPAGIPSSDWLFNDATTTTFPVWFHGYNLTFLNKLVALRPHWWRWLFYDRISNLILGAFGLIPLFLGLAYKKNKTQIFSFSLIIGIFLYFIIVAQGNIQHDYYQVLIVPFLAILSGFGYYYLINFLFSSKTTAIFLTLIIFIFSLYFSWDQIQGYYQIDRPQIVVAGQKAQEILPKNSLVIAPYTGDTAFLYQTGFSGWPVEIYDIPDKIVAFPNHPLYLVSVNYDQYTNSLIAKYPTVYKNNDYIILKLSP
jgi:hypothetical protein